ncbi:MAG: MerR family transcriptional regulator [Eubacteriales bacterium]|nr:MerR family transcriptional regulator [Eubacteriales bacterium]
MSYSIKQLSDLVGVSTRTLRFYDQIGLLQPNRKNVSGYREYDQLAVDRLQIILLYRELEFNLEAIRQLLEKTEMDPVAHLQNQRNLLAQREHAIRQQLLTIDRTLESYQEGNHMKDQAKFEFIKNKLIEENETKFGQEIRPKYGDDAVDQSNATVKRMDQATFDRAHVLANQTIEALLAAMDTGDSAGDLARETVRLHKEWLTIYWSSYSPEAHAGLGQMYVEDERFRVHYDQHRTGAAEFLRDAIQIWAERL